MDWMYAELQFISLSGERALTPYLQLRIRLTIHANYKLLYTITFLFELNHNHKPMLLQQSAI